MKELTPTRIAVAIAVSVLVLLCGIGAAIGGSYLLTLHTLNVAQANHTNSSIQLCKALRVLDDARVGIKFPAVNSAHPSEEALTKIFAGDHEVYLTSGCAELLKQQP